MHDNFCKLPRIVSNFYVCFEPKVQIEFVWGGWPTGFRGKNIRIVFSPIFASMFWNHGLLRQQQCPAFTWCIECLSDFIRSWQTSICTRLAMLTPKAECHRKPLRARQSPCFHAGNDVLDRSIFCCNFELPATDFISKEKLPSCLPKVCTRVFWKHFHTTLRGKVITSVHQLFVVLRAQTGLIEGSLTPFAWQCIELQTWSGQTGRTVVCFRFYWCSWRFTDKWLECGSYFLYVQVLLYDAACFCSYLSCHWFSRRKFKGPEWMPCMSALP